MSTKIDKPIIRSQETPRQIIFENYKSLNGELPITGGWGYAKDDAVIIDKNDPVVPEGLPLRQIFFKCYGGLSMKLNIGSIYLLLACMVGLVMSEVWRMSNHIIHVIDYQ